MSRLPQFLIEKIENEYGEETAKKIINGYKVQRKTTLRINTLKSNEEKVKRCLEDNNILYKVSSFWENALIIENSDESIIKRLDVFNNGEIYLQSLSSMLPPIILCPKENEDILDMTAAPGGKTTEIAALSNNKAHITACEMNKIRFERLKYNIDMQGAKCVYAMQEDARRIDDFFSFDKILLDAPCTGSGTININDSKLNEYFTENLLQKSIKSQKMLINKAIKILKNGGELIYSTCSILKEENEAIIEDLMKNNNIQVVNINVKEFEKLPKLHTNIKGTICLMPTNEFEGFFVAKLKKM